MAGGPDPPSLGQDDPRDSCKIDKLVGGGEEGWMCRREEGNENEF